MFKGKIFVALAISLFMGLGVSGIASGAESWETVLQKLYPASKKEGEVVLLSTNGNLQVGGDEGVKKFQERFPGIKFTITTISRTQTTTKVITEARAGMVTIDAYWDDPVPAQKMVARGLIAVVDPQDLTPTPRKFKFFTKNHLPVVGHNTNLFIYNTNLVKKSELPKGYEDLLKPQWKGKISMDGRGPYGFSHLSLVWSKERFWNFIKAFPKQNPKWVTRCTESTDKVVIGEAAIGCGSPRVEEIREKGAPIDIVPLNPILTRALVFVPVKGSPHPNATKLLAGWLLSPEGIKYAGKTGYGLAAKGNPFFDRIEEMGGKFFYTDDLTVDQIAAMLETRRQIGKTWGVFR
jgi:iron(III) transport system substrate-binding protein